MLERCIANLACSMLVFPSFGCRCGNRGSQLEKKPAPSNLQDPDQPGLRRHSEHPYRVGKCAWRRPQQSKKGQEYDNEII